MRGGSIRWLVFQKEGQIVAESLLYDNLVMYQGICTVLDTKGRRRRSWCCGSHNTDKLEEEDPTK